MTTATDTALTTPHESGLTASQMLQLATTGNLMLLSEESRWNYYVWKCRQLNLPPESQPFNLIATKQKKKRKNDRGVWEETYEDQLQLFPNRVATDKVADDLHLMREIVSGPEVFHIADQLFVRGIVRVRDHVGRSEDCFVMVPVNAWGDAAPKGKDIADAFSKWETKAKRRATLPWMYHTGSNYDVGEDIQVTLDEVDGFTEMPLNAPPVAIDAPPAETQTTTAPRARTAGAKPAPKPTDKPKPATPPTAEKTPLEKARAAAWNFYIGLGVTEKGFKLWMDTHRADARYKFNNPDFWLRLHTDSIQHGPSAVDILLDDVVARASEMAGMELGRDAQTIADIFASKHGINLQPANSDDWDRMYQILADPDTRDEFAGQYVGITVSADNYDDEAVEAEA